jgi:ATP-dependent helicase HrpB
VMRHGSMLLDEQQRPPTPGLETVAALIDRVKATRLAVLNWTDTARQLCDRLAFATKHLGGEWPAVDDKTLLATLDDWLAPFLGHATCRADLHAVDLTMVLTAMLSWDQQQELATRVPQRLTTAAGRAVTIDYSRDNPTVSVRVQDMFGMVTHPTIAHDTALTIELLSPAGRPIQITSDLPGFWSGSWAAVRKEMAGRYPKHQWPIDPSVALPIRMKDRPAD